MLKIIMLGLSLSVMFAGCSSKEELKPDMQAYDRQVMAADGAIRELDRNTK